MRDLSAKNRKGSPVRNRVKKERKPINFRAIFRKAARIVMVAGIAAAAAGLCFGLYTAISRTTLFRVEKIEVTNSNRLPREEVVELSGAKPGDGMLALNLRVMAEQLLKNPWIEDVKVRRYFPHTVSIRVSEREPLAVLNMNYLYYMDKKGDVFKPLNTGDSLDYPVITGLTEEELGKDQAGSKEALRKGVELIALLKSGGLFKLEDVSEIHLDKGYGFTLFTAQGGVPIKLGRDGFREKLTRLSKIYRELQGTMTTVDYIDLDYSDRIIVKKV